MSQRDLEKVCESRDQIWQTLWRIQRKETVACLTCCPVAAGSACFAMVKLYTTENVKQQKVVERSDC
jgi:hypothetical protein